MIAAHELGLDEVGAGLPYSSPYGYRINPVTHLPQFHEGIDLPAPKGTPVHAVAPGVVVRAELDHPVRGNNVATRFWNGWTAFFLHLDRLLVHRGEPLDVGQPVGLVGQTGRATGPHLHYAIANPSGQLVNPAMLYPEGTFYARS